MSLHSLIYGTEEPSNNEEANDGDDDDDDDDDENHKEKAIGNKKEKKAKKDRKKDKKKKVKKDEKKNGKKDRKKNQRERRALEKERQELDRIFTTSADTPAVQLPNQSALPVVVSATDPPLTDKKAATLERKRVRTERLIDWARLKSKVKRRKFDLRGERDVGGAIAHGIAAAPPKQPPADTTTTTTSSDTNEEETTTEQPASIMDQLLQSSQSQVTQQETAADDSEKAEPNLLSASMNNWQKGLQNSDEGIRQFLKGQAMSLVLPKGRGTKRSRDEMASQSEEATLVALPVPRKDLLTNDIVHLPVDDNVYTQTHFVHYRNARRLVARQIATGRHDMDRSTSKLMRMLWSRGGVGSHDEVLACRNTALLRSHLAQAGQRLCTFWSRSWNDRQEAARSLAVVPTAQLTGMTLGHGYSTRPMNNTVRGQVRLAGEEDAPAVSWHHISDGFAPQITYSPVPGTKPPLIPYPLDLPGVALGPYDKFVNAWNWTAFNDSTFRLTQAYLLSLLVKLPNDRQLLQLQLKSMSKRCMELSSTPDSQRMAAAFKLVKEPPEPHKFFATMGHMSICLNSPSVENSDEDSHDDDTEDSLVATARTLFSLCTEVKAKGGVNSFSRFTLCRGLFRIAKDLPETGAQVLSRSFNRECRTPIELVEATLACLENQHCLVDDRKSEVDSEQLVASEIEFAFHQAGNIFEEGLATDPTNTELRSWHLATTAASLLLCSGLKIGSGPRTQPSSLAKKDTDLTIDTEKNGNSFEVRLRLPKFQQLRQHTAKALSLLCHLCEKHIANSFARLTVLSFLEWKQVVALMLGSSCSEVVCAALASVHEENVATCCVGPHSNVRPPSVRDGRTATTIETAAKLVETNPKEVAHWRLLVSFLGPIGVNDSPCFRKHCFPKRCKECCSLSNGRLFDHAAWDKQLKSKTWWGQTRKSWWGRSVLSIVSTEHPSSGVLNAKHVNKLQDGLAESFQTLSLFPPVLSNSNSAASQKVFLKCLAEICSGEQSENRPPVGGEQNVILPDSTRAHHADESSSNCKHRYPFPLLESSSNDDLEMVCHQMVVAAHLFRPSNDWVGARATHLVERASVCAKNVRSLNHDSAELTALGWLYRMGLDASTLVKSVATRGRLDRLAPTVEEVILEYMEE